MSIRNLILFVVVVGGLTVFALENASPVVPLVVLGSETVALPLWVWLLGAIAAGALTALIIAGLIQVAGPSPRPPKNGYYSDRPRYRPPTDDAAFDDEDDWQVVDLEGDRPSNSEPFRSRPSSDRSEASSPDSSTNPTSNPGFFNRNTTEQDDSQRKNRTSFFSSFSSPSSRSPTLQDWDQFSLKRANWDDWNQYEEAPPSRQPSDRQDNQPQRHGNSDRPSSASPAEKRTAFSSQETIIQDSDDRDWQDWSGYHDDWRDEQEDNQAANRNDSGDRGYGDRIPYDEDRQASREEYSQRDDARTAYGREDYFPEDYGRKDYGREDYGRENYGRDDYLPEDDARDDYAPEEYDAPYDADPQESFWTGDGGSRGGDRYDETAYPADSYQRESDQAEPYRAATYDEEPDPGEFYQRTFYQGEYDTVVDVSIDDGEPDTEDYPYDDADSRYASGYGYGGSDDVEDEADLFGDGAYSPGDDLEDQPGYYTDYVRYSEEDDYYDDYDEYATAEQATRTARASKSEKPSEENAGVIELDDDAAWDNWEEETDNAAPSDAAPNLRPDEPQAKTTDAPVRDIYEVQQQPITVNRTGTIYSYSYRNANADSSESASEREQDTEDQQSDPSSENTDSGPSDEQNPPPQRRVLTTPPPQDSTDDSPSPREPNRKPS